MPRHQSEDKAWFLSGRSTSIRRASVQAWTLLAWSLLEHSDTIAPALASTNGRVGLPWLRIWDDALQRDEDPFTLTVFHPFSSEIQPIVRKAVWQRNSDLRRLNEPVAEREMPASFDPTITVVDTTVPRTEIEAILQSDAKLALPLIGLSYPDSVTSDVGSIGFEIYTLNQPQTKVSLKWSWPPTAPLEWQPVIDFAIRLRTFLEGCFP